MGNVSKIYKNGLLTTRYTYDGLNRLIREENKAFHKTWTYIYVVAMKEIQIFPFSFTILTIGYKML